MEFIVKRNKRFHWGLAFSTSISLYLFIDWIIAEYARPSGFRLWLIAILCILSFVVLLFLINAISQILKRTPALELNEYGLVDNVTPADLGLVKWSNIKSCDILKIQKSPHLVIILDDYDELVHLQSGIKQKISETNIKKYDTPLIINSKLLDIHISELKSQIEEFINEFRIDNQNSLDAQVE